MHEILVCIFWRAKVLNINKRWRLHIYLEVFVFAIWLVIPRQWFVKKWIQMILRYWKEISVLGERTVLQPLDEMQILHSQASGQTRGFVVMHPRLTAWFMTWPEYLLLTVSNAQVSLHIFLPEDEKYLIPDLFFVFWTP